MTALKNTTKFLHSKFISLQKTQEIRKIRKTHGNCSISELQVHELLKLLSNIRSREQCNKTKNLTRNNKKLISVRIRTLFNSLINYIVFNSLDNLMHKNRDNFLIDCDNFNNLF